MLFRRKTNTPIDAEQLTDTAKPPRGVLVDEFGRQYVMTVHCQAVYVTVGDWIVAEMDGTHFYPIKDHVFQATYEVV